MPCWGFGQGFRISERGLLITVFYGILVFVHLGSRVPGSGSQGFGLRGPGFVFLKGESVWL